MHLRLLRLRLLLQAVPQEIADVGAFLRKVLPPKN